MADAKFLRALLCPQTCLLSWEASKETAGQQLKRDFEAVASHVLSGKNAPAHTDGGMGRSQWTRSMDGQGRPWLRSAGWGRTAGVAVEEGGGGKRLGGECPGWGEELPSQVNPCWRAPSPNVLPSDPELHKATTSQLTSQFWAPLEHEDQELVLVQPC